MIPPNARIRTFRQRHESGCFAIPNPWDVASARLLERPGLAALATRSSGFAWSPGRADHQVTLDERLAHLRAMSHSVAVPFAELEGWFSQLPPHDPPA